MKIRWHSIAMLVIAAVFLGSAPFANEVRSYLFCFVGAFSLGAATIMILVDRMFAKAGLE